MQQKKHSTSWQNLELLIRVDLIRRLFSDNIQVILLEESQVFTCFRELTFFHTLTDVPVDECPLCIHHVVFLGDPLSEHAVDSNIVSNHGNVSWGRGHKI